MPQKSAALCISCVTFNSDKEILRDTLKSISLSSQYAIKQGLLHSTYLYLIDNGPNTENLETIQSLGAEFTDYFSKIIVKTGHGNVGYGGGHNLAIFESEADYHLILNPDVIADEKNIAIGVDYLNSHPKVGMLAPDAFDANGDRQFIAKRKPELVVLIARALKLPVNWKWLKKKMDQYEYRDKIPATRPFEIELASGCYMFCRSALLKQEKGFDTRYFMYFEDFDLSIRFRQCSKIVHMPEIKIIHLGGNTSSKGIKHIYYFCKSFKRFYMKYH